MKEPADRIYFLDEPILSTTTGPVAAGSIKER
jgi:hypothetical protein